MKKIIITVLAVFFGAQDINFGFSFGRHLTFDGEFGVGTAWVAAKLGIGYKF